MLSANTLSLIIAVVTCFFLKIVLRKRQEWNKGSNFRNYFPRVQWTSLNLWLIDGIISIVKLRKDGLGLLEEIVARHGKNVRGDLLGQAAVLSVDPNVIKKLLNSSDTGHLNKVPRLYEVVFSDLLKNGLFVAETEVWSAHRKVISRAFTYNSLPAYMTFINDGARIFMKAVCKAVTEKNGMAASEVENLFQYCVMKMTTEMIFGSVTSKIPEGDISEFQRLFERAKDIAVERILHPHLMIGPIWMFTERKRELKRLLHKIEQFSFKLIDVYREQDRVAALENRSSDKLQELETNMDDSLADNGKSASSAPFQFKSLVQHMITAGYGNTEIADEVNTFLYGGHDTAVTTFTFTVFHLAANPEHQQKCREEADRVMDAMIESGREELQLEDLSELKYLDRCIMETMRLTPPIPVYLRRLDTPLEINENVVVEVGNCVVVSPWLVHRDPELYPNPKVYDPDRFLPENVKTRHSHSFVPFSMGPRNCIGRKIGIMELKVHLAWMLRQLEWSTEERLDDIKVLFDVSIKQEKPFNIKFKFRKM